MTPVEITPEYHVEVIYPDETPNSNIWMKKLQQTCSFLKIDMNSIEKAQLVHNPKLSSNFNNYQNILMARQKALPEIYNVDSWKYGENNSTKKLYIEHLELLMEGKSWSETAEVTKKNFLKKK